MLTASLYITVCTTRNRIRARLRRLREPRYLIGAIVGGAYLYFSIFAGRRGRSARAGGDGRPPFELTSAWQTIGTPLAGFGVLVLATCAWFLPMQATLFEFSRAEIAFLFPWAVALQEIRFAGFMTMMVFLTILVVGFIYEWKKDALDWD